MVKENNIKKLNVDVANILKNEYVCWGLRIALVLYAAILAPNLNRDVSSIFDNVIVRLFFACVIVFLSFHDTTLAILLSIAFVVSIQTLNKHKVNIITSLPESFRSQETEEHNNESFQDLYRFNIGNKKCVCGKQQKECVCREQFKTSEYKQEEETSSEEKKTEGFMSLSESEEKMTEGFMSLPESETYSEQSSKVFGPPNNQFTTQAQLMDAANNLVNKNQVNSVTSFCPGLNAQGSNPPQGFEDWGYSQAVF